MAEPIHVVIAADANYAPGLKVTRDSIVRSCSRPERIVWHVFDETALDGLDGIEEFGLYNTSRMTYLRLFLPELLPDVDRVVYSDVDTVWNRDVCELAALFDPSVSVQWVRDNKSSASDVLPWMRKAGFAIDESRYGCAGVCIMNLEKMRRTRLGERAADLVRRFGTPTYADQDLLNAIYNRDCGLLPGCWDVLLFLPDWRTPAVYHLTGAGRHFHDAAASVYPPQYQLWWNVAHGTTDVHRRSRLLAALWPLRFLARVLPLRLRERVMRQCFYAKVLSGGLLSGPGDGGRCPMSVRGVNGMAVVDAFLRANGLVKPDEVWVHGMWTFDKWWRCVKAKLCGKTLVRMTHGSLSPVYLELQRPWMKRLAKPIERLLFAMSDRVVVTGPWEEDWNRAWGLKDPFETIDLRRFFDLSRPVARFAPASGRATRVLYLGRRHPLKGLELLEEAVKDAPNVELRAVSNAFGDEKEMVWQWCDVLVLPTLSENFGLVVAEALERGKPVVATNGAPAWKGFPGVTYLDGFVSASRERRVEMLRDALCRQGRASSETA